MDIGIRSRLETGFAVIGVGALVMTPVVAGQAAQAPTPAEPPAVMLTAATQPLQIPRLLTQRTTLAALQQLAPLQPLAPLSPLNPLAQQVGFHVAFVAEYVSFQLNLFVNLATIRVAAVGAFAPASYEGGAVNTNDDAAESVRDVKVSPTTRASTERPKKPKPFGVKVRLQRESRGETSTDTADVDGGAQQNAIRTATVGRRPMSPRGPC